MAGKMRVEKGREGAEVRVDAERDHKTHENRPDEGVSRTHLEQNSGARPAARYHRKANKGLRTIDGGKGPRDSGVLTQDVKRSGRLGLKGDAAPAKGSPAADGIATYHGREKTWGQRFWDWVGSHLDPRFAPGRPGGDMIRHSDIARDAENTRREEERNEFDEPTRPGVPLLGAAGFRASVARAYDVVGRVINVVWEVSGLKTRTDRADIADVSAIVAEGRIAMSDVPRWAWTKAKVREALLSEKGWAESDLATPEAQKVMDRAVDMVLTENVAYEIGERIRAEKDLDRETLKAEVLRRMEEMGLAHLSSDGGKAVDSLIDHCLIAKEAGILGEKGGLSVDQLAEVMATLYLTNNDSVRIDKAELTHVPIVGENMQKFYDHFHAAKQSRLSKLQPTTVSERKTAFLTALFHDAGKNVSVDNVRTVTGFTVLSTSPLNKTGVDIAVRPNETLREAVTRLGLDPGKLPLLQFAPFLVGTVVHHDSTNVLGYTDAATGARTPGVVDHLIERGILTPEEAGRMSRAIQMHGWVSTWILDQSFGGLGIRSNVFLDKKLERFRDVYLAVHGEMRKGVDPRVLEASRDVPFPKGSDAPARLIGKSWRRIMAELRGEFKKLPPDVQAIFFADHMGQGDVAKYLGILATKPVNADRSVYQLLFGSQAPDMKDFDAANHPKDTDMMENSVFGVMDTHGAELYALDKDMGAKADQVFGNVRDWLKTHLAASLLNAVQSGRMADADPKLRALAEDYDRYAAERRQAGQTATVVGWLQQMKVKTDGKVNPLLGTVTSALEADYYRDYAVRPVQGLHVRP